ncbi:DUF6435 family protein [Rhodocytophaga aerolata]|uniref:DUF6435 family protein n=1 Tax=Rhodocytophaga aerolata TaxID=455078 RepID=A0ABT8R1U7_9BACT|nr:Lacal_2735 family protein [Rhodocytophaga aerolata]MDO1445894.1 DUF6435 family protein [Rhodocytophaga aerolata]
MFAKHTAAFGVVDSIDFLPYNYSQKLMFGLFKKKDETALLQKKYEQLMQEARDIQRAGDMRAFALKTAEAEKVMDEIVAKKKKAE